jgi:DNA-directed RNA polymerase subunit omega
MKVPQEKITDKNKSRFTMVLAVARRANEINGGSTPLVKCLSKKPSTIALEEFKEGQVTFVDAEETQA